MSESKMFMEENEDHVFPGFIEPLRTLLDRNNRWDLPHELHMVTGSYESPRFMLIGTVPMDGSMKAIQILERMGRIGVPESVIGVLTITESWRHMTWEESLKVEGSLAQMLSSATNLVKDGRPAEVTDEEMLERARTVYDVLVRQTPPSEMPDEHRVEARTCSFVLRNGGAGFAELRRGDDVFEYHDNEELQGVGRLQAAMYKALGLEAPTEL